MQRRHALGFAIFCLLSGSEWIVDNAAPSTLPALEQRGLHYLLIGLAAGALLLFRRRRTVAMELPTLHLVAASILLLGLPALLDDFAPATSTRDGVGLFGLVPLCIVIGGASFGATPENAPQGRSLMLPALIGFAGTLLLLPFQLPSTTREGVLFATVFAAALSTAAGSLWMYRLLRGSSLVPALAVLCAANALFLGPSIFLQGLAVPAASNLPMELLRCALLDLPQLLLLLWFLRELDPTQLASRFLLVPLLSVIEAVIQLHPPIDLRLILGMLFTAGSGVFLLLAKPDADSEDASHLRLN